MEHSRRTGKARAVRITRASSVQPKGTTRWLMKIGARLAQQHSFAARGCESVHALRMTTSATVSPTLCQGRRCTRVQRRRTGGVSWGCERSWMIGANHTGHAGRVAFTSGAGLDPVELVLRQCTDANRVAVELALGADQAARSQRCVDDACSSASRNRRPQVAMSRRADHVCR